ncbi:polygalacturonase [Rhizoctonia solani]|uniref:endo-polygalacturonase n=1 Tax=Rhizoctonia solani TaxID=456999 RepID=A0A0K6GB86_9AGAM|nr:polygalacturonase [Rhizoctonia solani]
MITAVSILSLIISVLGNPVPAPSVLQARQSCTINSLPDVAAAEKCSTITIDAFTVPAGQKLVINPLDKATINMNGNIVFEADTTFKTTGPLFTLSGNGITFNGHGFTIDGQGAKYWDGQGSASDAKQAKPHPMINGTFENVKVLNSPAQVFSMGNHAALVVSNINIDNSDGNSPNGLSGTEPAAHNTDGFDVSTNDVTIQGSTIVNQDDCIAINQGSNIKFLNNHCTGGHGISVGSVASGSTVSNVQITGNTITNNVQALRIKTDADATSGSVSGVTYNGNTATGCTTYGVIIDQSYPATLGTSTGAGIKISGINFTGTNTIAVASSAKGEVEVNCAKGGCTGVWHWAGLKVSGGPAGTITNADITNFKL